MSSNQEYVAQLEELILTQLLPIRNKYYRLLGETPPELNLTFEFKLRQRVPALFQPKKSP
jgi:hypothetical protein